MSSFQASQSQRAISIANDSTHQSPFDFPTMFLASAFIASVATLIATLVSLKVCLLICCVLLTGGCLIVRWVSQNEGLVRFTPTWLHEFLTTDSWCILDVLQKVLQTGTVGFYFSRLCILLVYGPFTDDELLALLEGCNPKVIKFLTARGIYNLFPSKIQTLYSPSLAARVTESESPLPKLPPRYCSEDNSSGSDSGLTRAPQSPISRETYFFDSPPNPSKRLIRDSCGGTGETQTTRTYLPLKRSYNESSRARDISWLTDSDQHRPYLHVLRRRRRRRDASLNSRLRMTTSTPAEDPPVKYFSDCERSPCLRSALTQISSDQVLPTRRLPLSDFGRELNARTRTEGWRDCQRWEQSGRNVLLPLLMRVSVIRLLRNNKCVDALIQCVKQKLFQLSLIVTIWSLIRQSDKLKSATRRLPSMSTIVSGALSLYFWTLVYVYKPSRPGRQPTPTSPRTPRKTIEDIFNAGLPPHVKSIKGELGTFCARHFLPWTADE